VTHRQALLVRKLTLLYGKHHKCPSTSFSTPPFHPEMLFQLCPHCLASLKLSLRHVYPQTFMPKNKAQKFQCRRKTVRAAPNKRDQCPSLLLSALLLETSHINKHVPSQVYFQQADRGWMDSFLLVSCAHSDISRPETGSIALTPHLWTTVWSTSAKKA
jgi:hypothetical protein